MMPYQYEYVGDQPADFPTLGIRGVQKGDTVTSDEPLNSSLLKEIKIKDAKTEANEK